MKENQENMEMLTYIIKDISGEISAEEKAQLEAWLNESEENQKLYNDYKASWINLDKTSEDIQSIDVNAEWNKFKQNNMEAPKVVPLVPKEESTSASKVATGTTSGFSFMKIAAGFALVVSLGIGYVMNSSSDTVLADNGIKETKLEDGSGITLNQYASLELSDDFNDNERRVKLKGDANFAIAKNPEKPFIIDAGNIEITVLGTEFLVHAPEGDEYREVVVTEGKVQVVNTNPEGKPDTIILYKGDKVVYNVETKRLDTTIRIPNANSWRTRKFNFVEAPMQMVARRLNQMYHHEINFEQVATKKCEISVHGNDEPFETITDRIHENSDRIISFQKKSDRYIIKGNCNF